MTVKRIPLEAEPISGINEVVQYDRYSGFYMLPEYKYFVWKILRTGIRDVFRVSHWIDPRRAAPWPLMDIRPDARSF